MTGGGARIVGRVLYAAALTCALGAIACLLGNGYYLATIVLSCRISGYGALAFLAIALTVPSLARLSATVGRPIRDDHVRLTAKRSGRCAAALALVHAGVVIAAFVRFDWLAIWQVTYMRSGVAAATILLLLWLTSFERLNRWLGWRLFKPLHRLTYVAAALVLHHLLLSPFASRRWTFILFGSLGVVMLLRLLPRPKKQRTK